MRAQSRKSVPAALRAAAFAPRRATVVAARRAAAVALALIAAAAVEAQVGFRNISSASLDTYFDGSISTDVNQVFLFDLLDWLSGELKIQRLDSAAVHETSASIAPIFIVSAYNYVIARYTVGYDSAKEWSHAATIDANYESETLRANITLRGAFYPQAGYWFLIPSIGGKYVTPPRLGILGRYFFSYNSDGQSSHALLWELDFPITEAVTVKAGGSTTFNPPGSPTQAPLEYSFITGASFTITSNLQLRYHLEYLGRQNLPGGIRNLLVLDARL